MREGAVNESGQSGRLTVTDASLQVLDEQTGQEPADSRSSTTASFTQQDVQIDAGALLALSVWFRPITAGDHPAHMEIRSTDPPNYP